MARVSYQEQGRVYLGQALDELARGDFRQASEKGWGAASQMVKAVADTHGWDHTRHGNLYDVARRLTSEQGDVEYARLFRLAEELHTNFYEGNLEGDDIASHLQAVAWFVDKVEELLRTG